MRIIDSSQSGNSIPTRTDRTEQTQAIESRSGASRGAKRSSEDRVELSSFAGRLSGALETAAEDRAARVSRIAEIVRSGMYQVDSRAVSHAIVGQAISSGNSE